MSSDLWGALAASDTFWSEVVWRGLQVLLMFICMVILLGVIGRRRKNNKLSALLEDQRGSWMIEFVLMVPIMTMFFVVMGQTVVLMRTAMVVHYSAYSAARSARVHMPTICGKLAKVDPGRAGTCGAMNKYKDYVEINKRAPRPVSQDYEVIANFAARKVLVSASPVNNQLSCWDSATSCEVPEYFEKIAFEDQLGDAALVRANRKRAQYAFDPPNLELELIVGELSLSDFQKNNTQAALKKVLGPEIALTKGNNADDDLGYPVTAKVTFRANLMFPYFSNIGMFGAQSGSDSGGYSRYYSNIHANVTVY